MQRNGKPTRNLNETRLANGLTIISDHMPHVETVALGVWVATGARHESARETGISHFIEHMAFKGTAKRNAREIVEEIEEVGGELNAATSLDSTAFYARVLKADIGVALEILADIMLNPTYPGDDLERERNVILQEIAATRDSPDEIVMDLLQDAAFPRQPLGRPILGTAKSVGGFSAMDLHRFRQARYHGGDMVLSVAGNVDHAALVRHAEALFGALRGGERIMPSPARYTGGTRLSARRFEQAHVVMGHESPSYREPDFYATQVFSGLFGGGMSSRLFQEVREKRGLCYSIYSSAWGLNDTGMFSIHAATAPDTMDTLIEVVATELDKAAASKPKPGEVRRAKSQLKAGLLMSLESPIARAEQMARQMQALGRLMPTAELIEKVDAVGAEQVRGLAERLLTKSPLSFALAGAGKSGRDIVDNIGRRARRH
jgi:predicted Zn-dependent peptidase